MITITCYLNNNNRNNNNNNDSNKNNNNNYNNPLAHRAKRGARVLISTRVESCYTSGD